ncbi:MAG TPA: hypothetical protein VMV98_02415 [Acidobacteriaceae bacterium]|nr:hypothetical protein [Acidobacteriaceae bacterium]
MEWELHSWQKHLPCAVEFREESPPVAPRAHDQGRPFQFINYGFAVYHLAELDATLSKRIFQFGQAEFHLQNGWREGFTEARGLFGRPPIREVRLSAGCVFDNDVLHPALKAVCSGLHAFYAGRGGRNDAYCRESNVSRGDIRKLSWGDGLSINPAALH